MPEAQNNNLNLTTSPILTIKGRIVSRKDLEDQQLQQQTKEEVALMETMHRLKYMLNPYTDALQGLYSYFLRSSSDLLYNRNGTISVAIDSGDSPNLTFMCMAPGYKWLGLRRNRLCQNITFWTAPRTMTEAFTKSDLIIRRPTGILRSPSRLLLGAHTWLLDKGFKPQYSKAISVEFNPDGTEIQYLYHEQKDPRYEWDQIDPTVHGPSIDQSRISYQFLPDRFIVRSPFLWVQEFQDKGEAVEIPRAAYLPYGYKSFLDGQFRRRNSSPYDLTIEQEVAWILEQLPLSAE